MTIYYIDPADGNDSNTGLSWAQAWKTLKGLRAATVVPAAGDEIRFAKSPTFTPDLGDYVREAGAYLYWYLRGQEILATHEPPAGINTFQTWASPGTDMLTVKCPVNGFINGAMTVDVPSWAGNMGSNYHTIHAISADGAYRDTDQLLFGGGGIYLSSFAAGGMCKFQGVVRCSVPYTGTGDVDLPAGSLVLSVFNGSTELFSAPLPAIRNSADIWTPFEIDFTPLPSTTLSNIQVRISRSSVALDRDSSPFGLEFSPFAFMKYGGINITDTIFSLTRSSFSGAASPEIVGTNDMGVFLERLNAIEMDVANDIYTASDDYNDRVGSTVTAYLKCFRVQDVAMTGRLPDYPTGSTGVYDLNGSVGGTSVSPIKITGGWDKGTNTVTGVTAFSAGIPHQFCSPFAWIDMHGATNIQFENLVVGYGFSSFVSRPGTVSFKKCMLPFSLSPAFGVVDINSNITLEDMYVAPMVLEGFGTIGNLTLKNVYYLSQQNSKAGRRNEVNNFNMNNSHWGLGNTFYGTLRPTYIRGDALLEQCSLVRPPQLVSVMFGHSLVFRNHKVHPATWTVYPIPTAPESRWDLIDYEDASMPTYNFGTPPATGATCDAKAMIASSMFITANHYPTGLRGHRVLNLYTDGLNDFMSTSGLASSENTERGYLYAHFMGQRPAYSTLETPNAIANYGDIATPSWYTERMRDTGVVTVQQTPQITASARVFISKKFENVTYRTNDEFYVVSAHTPPTTSAFQWTTVKAVYIPKAGQYRARFGCMKENVSLSTIAYENTVLVPLQVYQTSEPEDSGALLGRFGVFSNSMVGLSKSIDYYASTPEEVESGSGGNTNRDQWKDYYVDFEMSAAGLVEMRHGSNDAGMISATIFDFLNIYERT